MDVWFTFGSKYFCPFAISSDIGYLMLFQPHLILASSPLESRGNKKMLEEVELTAPAPAPASAQLLFSLASAISFHSDRPNFESKRRLFLIFYFTNFISIFFFNFFDGIWHTIVFPFNYYYLDNIFSFLLLFYPYKVKINGVSLSNWTMSIINFNFLN